MRFLVMVAVVAILASTALAAAPKETATSPDLMKSIRKELVKLPYYGIFDNLSFKIDSDTVTLYGQVLRPITRKEPSVEWRR